MTEQHFVSTCESATEALGRALGRAVDGGTVIALRGNLGSGKTVMARGIGRGLGVDEPITSPTFTLVQEYTGQRWRFYHIDLYRLAGEAASLELGIDEFLFDREAVTVIEWAERAGGLLPPHIEAEFSVPTDDGQRCLRIYNGPRLQLSAVGLHEV